MTQFFAHSVSGQSKEHWQGLSAHSVAVAGAAEKMAPIASLAAAARLAGLLHDVGKYTPRFQRRLEGANIDAPHAIAGAAMVLELFKNANGADRVMAELIAHAIAGHHAGLPDRLGEGRPLDTQLQDFDPATLDPIWRQQLDPPTSGIWSGPGRVKKTRQGFYLGFLGRMLFSCLVDADFKDTEHFYLGRQGRVADRDWPSLQALLPDLITKLDTELANIAAGASTDTAVNKLRGRVLQHVRAQAGQAPGLFTLTVPTGGGKTLTSLAFALDHAKTHGLARIIYAIPYTSVIDQTAGIFAKIFGKNVVLEHHSAIDREKSHASDCGRDKLRLAMEDWAAPIVVTTTVQLFESLFSARPSRCRKLHNIARSIIILDEAQTLPRHLLMPMMHAIEQLATHYGVTVILCTATQPALAARDNFDGLPLTPERELAPDPAGLAQQLRRTRLEFVGPMDNDALVAALAGQPRALTIVNSRAHALDLYHAAKAAGLEGVVHLTTRQHATDRRTILRSVGELLHRRVPCRLIATSLVEAGVDLDFPRVFRAEAGLDQIAQAAGRCNREGKHPADDSLVSVFEPLGYTQPSEIAALVGDFKRMRANHADLFSPAAIEGYFHEVFWRQGAALDRERIVEKFRFSTTQGTNLAYRTVDEQFRMIESGLLPVIVPTDAASRKAVAELGIADIPSGRLARALQSYIVQVPPKARAQLVANKAVTFVAEALRGDQFAVLQTATLYSAEKGLVWKV
jgi:CRISPR-associated endonuclease/helicase Cas3